MAANEQSVVFSDSAIEDSLSLTAGLSLKSKSPSADAKEDGFGRISEASENQIPMSIFQNLERGVPNCGRIGAFQLNLANPAHYANQVQHRTPAFLTAGTRNEEIKAPSLFIAKLANACRRVPWSTTPALSLQPAMTKKP